MNQDELKFKAWHNKNKRMYEVLSISFEDKTIQLKNSWNTSIYCDIKDVIILQFTGLKDGNKRGIFEGDIFKDWQGGLSIVAWVEFRWEFEAIGEDFKYRGNFHNIGEIKGNIYEDARLLEEAKDL